MALLLLFSPGGRAYAQASSTGDCPSWVAQLGEAPGAAGGWQCLTLEEAEAMALRENRSLEASRARAEAAQARTRTAGAFRFPQVALEGGVVRSDDPVAAFGARLRQGRFTQADFAPELLNHPDPVEDWTAGLGVRWTALDPALLSNRRAANEGARAAVLEAGRTAEAVRFQARLVWIESVRTGARLEAARQAEESARANAALLERRRDEGVVTDADLLQAQAALAHARARRLNEEREALDARARMAVHLGLNPDSAVAPAGGGLMLDEVVPRPAASPAPLEERRDLRASGAALAAVEARAQGARRARLPTVEAFGRWSTHAPGAFDDREQNLTLGLQLSLPLFTGFALTAAADEAQALERAAAAEHRARMDQARAEVEEARRAVRASRGAVEAAQAAAAAAGEAARLMRRRFEEGLATTAELLQVEASAADLRASAVDAQARSAAARATFAFLNPSYGTMDR